jgi:methionyl-tRNA formyltransferase
MLARNILNNDQKGQIAMSKKRSRKQVFSAFFADSKVGLEAVRYVHAMHTDHIKCVITTDENEISGFASAAGHPVFHYDEITKKSVESILGGVDFIFLAWWPKIIPDFIIRAPKIGVVNFHPSLLPYNRGKHYNFWTIVEDTPFGVTLHFVDSGIDTGDIIFQSIIEKSWEDTGGSLYSKATDAMIKLFKNRYLDIVEGKYQRTQQNVDFGQTHYAKELDPSSEILLHKEYSARELLNLLRARTFAGKPACYFWDNNRKYEVRVSIKEVGYEPL